MSQLTTRINTTAAKFPLRPVSQGRTIIVPQAENYYETGTGSPDLAQNNSRGIPTFLYAQDVLPTAAGYKSVGYIKRVLPIASYPAAEIPRFTFAVNNNIGLVASQATRILITYVIADGSAGVYQLTNAGTWLGIANVPNVDFAVPTVATVSGITYICFTRTGFAPSVFRWQLGSLVPVVLTSLAAFQGITAASGYMIAWYQATIAWSSVVSPTDFTPSLITGAGGGAVQECESDIQFCVPVQNGFLIITKGRTIAATYSGNPRYPFNFKVLQGGNGLQFLDSPNHYQITTGTEANFVYAYNSAGLQQVSLVRVSDYLPEVTDFLSGDTFDTFDTSTYSFGIVSRLFTNQRGPKKVTLVGNRYLVISYSTVAQAIPSGVNAPYLNTPIFDTALVVDTAMDRFGKINFQHIDCFELILAGFAGEPYPGIGTVENPLGLMRFVAPDSSVYSVSTNPVDPALIAPMKGVIIFGKFQLSRQNLFHLQEVDVEEVQQDNLVVIDWPTIDGKNTLPPVTGTDVDITSKQRVTLFREPGLNHTVGIVGAFDVNTVVLKFYSAGRR